MIDNSTNTNSESAKEERPSGMWMSKNRYPISVSCYYPEEGDDIWEAYRKREQPGDYGVFKYGGFWFLVDEDELFIIPEYVKGDLLSIYQFVAHLEEESTERYAFGRGIGAKEERERIRQYAAIINGLPAPEDETTPF